MPTDHAGPGRPRDPDLDEAILRAARDQLATHGYDGMSVAAVATEAGTTRQAVYRRWPGKADLATAAVASMSQAAERVATDDPFRDLVEELAAFQRGVSRPNGISMVGSMLQDGTDPQLKQLFRQRLVEPRRARFRDIFERSIDGGALADDADVDSGIAACTGILYAQYLTGRRIPADWAETTARFVWRGMGG